MSRRQGITVSERVDVSGEGPTQRIITCEVRLYWPPGTDLVKVRDVLNQTFVEALASLNYKDST